jgi:dynein heavy chain
VQTIFLEGKALVDKKDERAPLYPNLPPIAGSLTWCRSLFDRIKEPMDKLQNLSANIIDREEFKDVQKLYQSIVKSIKDYEDSRILAWQKESDESSKDKMQEFLLKRDEDDLLKVNFDPALVRLLRETRYFLLLDRSIPQSASDLYKNDDTLRRQVNALDSVVIKYNYIKTCLIPVEEPLITKRIANMDQILKPGIEKHIWKSPEIDQFIDSVRPTVEDIFAIVEKMKHDLEKIREVLHQVDEPLLERKNKPVPVDEFMNQHNARINDKKSKITLLSQQILRFVKEIGEVLKVDKKSPSWKDYTDYVDEVVLNGVIKAITTSCDYLENQIHHELIDKHQLQPIFEIKLDLSGKEIKYEPEIDNLDRPMSIINCINSWIKDFINLGHLIKRIGHESTADYIVEIRDSFEVKDSFAKVFSSVEWIINATGEFRKGFDDYSYLWDADPNDIFEKFVDDEVSKEMEIWRQKMAQQEA